MRRLTILAGVLLLAVTAAIPAHAAERRPMRGTFDASVAPAAQRCGPAALTLGFQVHGVATHLGQLSGSGSNCTEFTLATSAVAVWDGLATLTAADGSTISTTSNGRQDQPVAGLAGFAVIHHVTGGTGRFAGASGIWTVSGTIDVVHGTLDGTVSGWLSF